MRNEVLVQDIEYDGSVDEPDLPDLLDSWGLHLRAERKSPQTIKTYTDGVRAYLRWCAATGAPSVLDRQQLRQFVDDLLSDGAQPATAVSRQLGVRRFASWLTDEGELDVDPLLGVKSPKLDKPVIEPLSTAQLKALLAACTGRDLRSLRDAALVQLMYTTGVRAGEAVALQRSDLDLKATPPTAIIRRGKGGKGRVIPLPLEVGVAIERYVRARKDHQLAGTDQLWLGDRGKGFSYDALHKTLGERAERAGIPGFHPHLLRHTAAHRWLTKGGSEGGLMAMAGWTRPDMLIRYTQAQASARAAEEAQRLNLGEL